MIINKHGPAPANSLRVNRWADLAYPLGIASYRVISTSGKSHIVQASKKRGLVLQGLMRSPIYAASVCRISDHVLHLIHDDGIEIDCWMYRNDPETGRERYGVYVLKSTVNKIDRAAVAA